jgi:hypothetical protein
MIQAWSSGALVSPQLGKSPKYSIHIGHDGTLSIRNFMVNPDFRCLYTLAYDRNLTKISTFQYQHGAWCSIDNFFILNEVQTKVLVLGSRYLACLKYSACQTTDQKPKIVISISLVYGISQLFILPLLASIRTDALTPSLLVIVVVLVQRFCCVARGHEEPNHLPEKLAVGSFFFCHFSLLCFVAFTFCCATFAFFSDYMGGW